MAKPVFTCFIPSGEISVVVNGVETDYYLDGALVEDIRRQAITNPAKAYKEVLRLHRAYLRGGRYYERDTSN